MEKLIITSTDVTVQDGKKKPDDKLPDKYFSHDVFLFSTVVAGTIHIMNIKEILKEVEIGDILSFSRERENNYDNLAISINLFDETKIGYVPRSDNQIFSRLMDAGKLLFGKVRKIEEKDNWDVISIDIYLKD